MAENTSVNVHEIENGFYVRSVSGHTKNGDRIKRRIKNKMDNITEKLNKKEPDTMFSNKSEIDTSVLNVRDFVSNAEYQRMLSYDALRYINCCYKDIFEFDNGLSLTYSGGLRTVIIDILKKDFHVSLEKALMFLSKTKSDTDVSEYESIADNYWVKARPTIKRVDSEENIFKLDYFTSYLKKLVEDIDYNDLEFMRVDGGIGYLHTGDILIDKEVEPVGVVDLYGKRGEVPSDGAFLSLLGYQS